MPEKVMLVAVISIGLAVCGLLPSVKIAPAMACVQFGMVLVPLAVIFTAMIRVGAPSSWFPGVPPGSSLTSKLKTATPGFAFTSDEMVAGAGAPAVIVVATPPTTLKGGLTAAETAPPTAFVVAVDIV